MQLKEFRKKIGLSQDEIAQKLGVHNTTYGNWELGKTEPDINKLIQLADFYHVSLDELVGRPTSLINRMVLTERQQTVIDKIIQMNDKQVEMAELFIETMMG